MSTVPARVKKRKLAPKSGTNISSKTPSSSVSTSTSTLTTATSPSTSTATATSSQAHSIPQSNSKKKKVVAQEKMATQILSSASSSPSISTQITENTSTIKKKRKKPKGEAKENGSVTLKQGSESKVASGTTGSSNGVATPSRSQPAVNEKVGSRKKKRMKNKEAGKKAEAEAEKDGETEEGSKKEKTKGEKHPCCFLDVSIDGVNAGRIVIELFRDILPKTCENFRALCTGEKSTETKKLHYKGSVIHRITPDFVFQGGDFENGDGTGGQSIYGAPFEDEGFFHRHLKPGVVAMANKGKDRNTSQFYITLSKKPLKYLDSKHVVFGKVIVGMAVVRSIERAGTAEGVPKAKVVITDCGRFKLKTERKKIAGLPEAPVIPKPTCPKCQGGLKYVQRLPKKKLVRFWCKNKECEEAVYLPDARVPTTAITAA